MVLKMMREMFFFYLTIILVTAKKHCREDDEDDIDNFLIGTKIINGQAAKPGQFPWQVGIFNGKGFCGGALISNQWILTAAHCVYNRRSFQIYLGATNSHLAEASRISTSVWKAFYHPHYNYPHNFNNDMALLQLAQPVKTNENIKPIKLPSYGDKVKTNEAVWISGWGQTSDIQKRSVNNLNYVDLFTISNEECRKIYNPDFVPDTIICCQGIDKKSTCHGDSGGPLIQEIQGEWILVGVVSFGGYTCEVGLPIAFSRTESYLDFIYDHTGL